MVNLKPCPFCGAKENLLDLDQSRWNRFFVCTTCGARGPLSAWSDPDHAAKLWNRRAGEDRIEELEAENKRLSGLVASPHPGSQDKLMYRDRAIAAEVKLARVKEMVSEVKGYPTKQQYISGAQLLELWALLHDTRKPLAVVESFAYMADNAGWIGAVELPPTKEGPVTVIVMTKEVE